MKDRHYSILQAISVIATFIIFVFFPLRPLFQILLIVLTVIIFYGFIRKPDSQREKEKSLKERKERYLIREVKNYEGIEYYLYEKNKVGLYDLIPIDRNNGSIKSMKEAKEILQKYDYNPRGISDYFINEIELDS